MWMDIARQEGGHDPRNSEDEDELVYDRTNPFSKPSTSKDLFEQQEDGEDNNRRKNRTDGGIGPGAEQGARATLLDEQDTRCGLCSWRPHFLQRFANKTVFSVIFTIVGVLHSSIWSYYTATISTMEKRFRMDSITSGVLLFSNELAQLLITVLLTYFNFRRHRHKMLTMGVVLTSISCFLMASPHFFMGSGEMTLRLVKPRSGVEQHHTFVTVPDGDRFDLDEIPESARLVQEDVQSVITGSPTNIFSSSSSSIPSTQEDTQTTDVVTNDVANQTNDATNQTNDATNQTNTIEKTATISSSTATTTTIQALTEEETEPPPTTTTPQQVVHSHENDEMYSVWPTCQRDIEHINASKTYCDDELDFERKLTFGFIFTANFIFGVASMLYLLSGGPFAEESTIFPNEIPRIFGITVSIRLIGSFFGYLFAWSCLNEFVNPFESPIQIDSRWLGAYWMGWLCLSIFMAVFALIFSLFPRQSPRKFLKKKSLTQETGLAMLLVPSIAPFFGGAELKTANVIPSILNIPGVFQALFRNRVYLLLTFSTMAHIFVSVGYLTFLPKYLEFMFRLRASDAALLTGVSSVPFQVAGLMLSGAFIARYLPSPKEISHWSCVVAALQIVSLMIMSFLGCQTNKVDVSFVHAASGGQDSNSSSLLHCSGDCDCGTGPPLPVCDLYTGTAYYSPCHAGCDEVTNQTGIFTQCSCLPFDNVTLVEGFCPGDGCGNGLIAFLVFFCLGQFLRGSGVVGRMLLSYKSLQADQRSAIIGFTLFILSVLCIIPSPIVFGSLFEAACLVREKGSCDNNAGESGGGDMANCWFYNDASLRFIYNLSAAAFMVVAFALDAILWKNRDVHDLRIYDGELQQLASHSAADDHHRNRFATVSLT